MEMKKMHWAGIGLGLILAAITLIIYFSTKAPNKNLTLFVLGIAVSIILLPFVIDSILSNRRDEEIALMFLEFSRSLSESVNVGTPVSKSIVNMASKNYGELTPYIKKLANQIELGVPVSRALENFARDVNSKVVYRAIALIREAERAGGEIDYILASVAASISEIEKLKKERQAAIFNLIVQGYLIFFIFIGIVLILEFNVLPITQEMGGLGLGGGNLNSLTMTDTPNQKAGQSPENISYQFIYLLITQGFFAGLVIGKISEGSLKAGIKHSFILSTAAFLISSGARLIFAGG